MSTTSNEVLQSLKEIIARILKVPVSQLTSESGPKTLRNWDSLRHVELVMEIETAYGVSFAPDEIFEMTSVQSFCDLLLKKKATSKA